MKQISDFIKQFRALQDDGKREFVAFFIPIYSAATHQLVEPRPFGQSTEINGDLETLMKDCEKIDPKSSLLSQITNFLELNEMCLKKGDSSNQSDVEEDGVQFTVRILMVVRDLSDETQDDFVPVSGISERVDELGFEKSKVGGSVTSLLNSGFLDKREDHGENRERYVALSQKGKNRLEKF